jgi:hypothetical protein
MLVSEENHVSSANALHSFMLNNDEYHEHWHMSSNNDKNEFWNVRKSYDDKCHRSPDVDRLVQNWSTWFYAVCLAKKDCIEKIHRARYYAHKSCCLLSEFASQIWDTHPSTFIFSRYSNGINSNHHRHIDEHRSSVYLFVCWKAKFINTHALLSISYRTESWCVDFYLIETFINDERRFFCSN